MKNRKSMVGGILALSLVLAGTGYAYWTDSLNVTTTASTGNLDVTFVDLGLYAQYGSDTDMTSHNRTAWSVYDGIGNNGYVAKTFFGDGDYNTIAAPGTLDTHKERSAGWNKVEFGAAYENPANISIQYGPYGTNTLGDDRIDLSIENMYPGYAQIFRSDIINTGTVAAKLSQLSFAVPEVSNNQTKSMLGIAIKLDRDDNNGFKYSLADQFQSGDTFSIGNVKFVRLSALTGSKSKVTIDDVKAMVMTSDKPDGRMDLFVGVAMDPDASGKYTTGSVANYKSGNNDADTQFTNAKVSIDLNWDQFNAK